jgi:low affinity Fe/Cu permease
MARASGNPADPEQELSRLIDEVRAARERLAELIRSIRAGRPEWQGREHHWARWGREMRQLLQRPAGPKVH